MPEIKVGIKLANLGLPFNKAIHVAASLGADAVEIDARGELNPRQLSQTAIRQIRKKLDDHQLKVCAVGFATRRGYDVEQDLQPRIEATKAAMKFAYELGTNVVVNQAGQVSDDTESLSWNMMVDALTDIGKYGHQAGAFLALETGTEEGERLKKLIEALPDGSVGVNYDPGNLVINGFSPIDALQELASEVMHVHAKDAVRDLAQGRGLEVPLGRGSVEFANVMGILEEAGYRGYFTVERENSSAAIQEIGYAVQYLRNL